VFGLTLTREELQARAAARCAGFAPPPKVPLPTLGRFGLRELYAEGAGELEAFERGLLMSSRIDGALDLAIAEGLLALEKGDRLLRLGLCLDDYAREFIDLEPSTVTKRVRLAKRLRTRPLLREALRTGKVSLCAAQVIAPVAKGDAEAGWVERAASPTETVRTLEEAVKQLRSSAEEEDEEWGRLTIGATEEELAVIEQGLDVASQQLPGSRRSEQLEAMAQEWLGAHPEVTPEQDPTPGGMYRSTEAREAALAARKKQLEEETERWRTLDRIPQWKEPEIRWNELDSLDELVATLTQLAEYRRAWDELVGWMAYEIKGSGLLPLLGFATFRHYIVERLGLPPRAIEQRAELERRIRKSPALLCARANGVSYERLRALANLPEEEIVAWLPRAKELTVIALRRALDDREARQMRAQRWVVATAPERVARLLSSAFEAVRAIGGKQLTPGRCLATIAQHFVGTHGPPQKPKTSSQKVRARDRWRCMVPGCSHFAAHSHHIEFRSQGGDATDPANQTGICPFHHKCIHDGYMTLVGTAPDALVWLLREEVWTGRPTPAAS
jgi:hypothetical protein